MIDTTTERELIEATVQALVVRARAGDGGALAELYERFEPRIQSYLSRQLGTRVQEAEDLTAEVFTRMVEKIGGYEPRGVPFSAWLFRIAHNALIDQVRKRQKAVTFPIEDAAEVRDTGSFQDVDTRFTRDQVGEALVHLTLDQQEVVRLRYLKGLNLLETATALGKTEDAVKKLQSRGLASLRRSLECESGCWRVVLDSSG